MENYKIPTCKHYNEVFGLWKETNVPLQRVQGLTTLLCFDETTMVFDLDTWPSKKSFKIAATSHRKFSFAEYEQAKLGIENGCYAWIRVFPYMTKLENSGTKYLYAYDILFTPKIKCN